MASRCFGWISDDEQIFLKQYRIIERIIHPLESLLKNNIILFYEKTNHVECNLA
jgi:hypothetical protein